MSNKKICSFETDCDSDRIICPECGGKGEVINENHLIADTSWKNRYTICSRCFGIGNLPCQVSQLSRYQH